MISYGKPEYIEDLKMLWRKTFCDSKTYVDLFFEKIYLAENTLVFVENDRVVSALYMIPYKLLKDGRENSIAYLYALATDPEFRGRKIMSMLITKSLDICKERNYALSVLIPAEDSLLGFYRNFGYEECFEQVKITKTLAEVREEAKNQIPADHIKADAGQIWNAYSRSRFFDSECVILSEEQNEFYIEVLEKEGGEAWLLKTGGKEYYALLNRVKDNISVYETDLDSAGLKPFYAALLKEFDFKTLTFYQPLYFNEEETRAFKRPFAMSKNLAEIDLNKPFLNRVLV